VSQKRISGIKEVFENGSNQRDAKWTEAIAVGDKAGRCWGLSESADENR